MTEKSCNLSEERVDLHRYKGSGSVKPVLKNICQSNTYREDLSCPHFDNEPRFQGKQQMKGQQYCMSVFVASLKISRSNQGHQPRCDNSIQYMGTWQIHRDTRQPQEKETLQNELNSNFLGRSFSNRDNVRAPI